MELKEWQKTLIAGIFIAIISYMAVDYIAIRDYITADREFKQRIVEFMAAGDRNTQADGNRRDSRLDELFKQHKEIFERLSAIEEHDSEHEKKHHLYDYPLQRNSPDNGHWFQRDKEVAP